MEAWNRILARAPRRFVAGFATKAAQSDRPARSLELNDNGAPAGVDLEHW